MYYRNVFPFIPVYVMALSSFLKFEPIGAIIICAMVLIFHILTFFMCIWSLRYRIHIQYDKVRIQICILYIGE